MIHSSVRGTLGHREFGLKPAVAAHADSTQSPHQDSSPPTCRQANLRRIRSPLWTSFRSLRARAAPHRRRLHQSFSYSCSSQTRPLLSTSYTTALLIALRISSSYRFPFLSCQFKNRITVPSAKAAGLSTDKYSSSLTRCAVSRNPNGYS